MKKVIALSLTVVLILTLLAGCAGSGAAAVVGSWAWEYEGIGEVLCFTFNEDGTGAMDSFGEVEEFTYTVTGNKINMTIDKDVSSYQFHIKGKTMFLTINQDEELTLTKK